MDINNRFGEPENLQAKTRFERTRWKGKLKIAFLICIEIKRGMKSINTGIGYYGYCGRKASIFLREIQEIRNLILKIKTRSN